MGGRAGGGARSGGGGGGAGGFASAESVWSKAFEDSKFRVGVSKDKSGNTYSVVTTNAKLDGGGKLPIKKFTSDKGSVMKLANALKAGKTYNQAYFEATGRYVNG